MKQLLRYTIIALGGLLRLAIGLVLVLALVAVGALAALQTAPGRVGAERLIMLLASGKNSSLAISGLEISWGLDAKVARIEMGDTEGVYLTLNGIAVEWSPSALFSGLIDVDRAHVDQAYLVRLPVAGEEKAPASGGIPFIPPLRLAQAEVPEILLGEAIAGVAMRLSASADARIQSDPQLFEVNLDVTRRDEQPGEVGAHLRFAPGSDTLAFDISASEPRGGLAARLLAIDGLPALDLELKGDGPLDDWTAELALALDGQTEITGTARMVASDEGRRLEATLAGDVAALAPPVAQALLMGRTALEATISFTREFAPRTVEATVRSSTLDTRLEAAMDETRLKATGTARLSAGTGALIALDLPDRRVTLGDTQMDIRLAGPRESLEWSLALDAASVETTEARLSSLSSKMSGKGLDLASLGTAEIPLGLETRVEDVRPKIAGAEMFAGPLSLSASARVDAGSSVAILETLTLVLAPLTAELGGTVSTDAVDASLRVAIADLAVFDPRVSGGLDVMARATGNPASPEIGARITAERLHMAGKPVTGLVLDVDATTAPDDLSADIELTASVDGNPLAGRATLEPDGAGLVGRTLEVSVGRNRISGDLRISDLEKSAETLAADLGIEAPDLSQFSALALTELAGSLSGRATIAPGPKGPTAQVSLSGREIAVAGARLARISTDIKAERLLSTPAVTARATIDNLLVGGQDIVRLVADAATQGITTELTLDARLAKGERADGLALAATLTPTVDGMSVRMTRADGRYRGLSTSLAGPAEIVSAGGETTINGLAIRLGDGRLDVSGKAGSSLDITARATSVPLALANAVAPGFGLSGRAAGTASITGASSAPRARWSIQLADVMATPLASNGLGALAIDTRGEMQGQRLSQTTRVTGADGLNLTTEGPISLEGAGRLDIDVSGSLPLAAARQKLVLSGFSGTGGLALSGRVTGALSNPAYALSLRPQAMSLTQLSSGLTLQDLSGTVRIAPEGVTVDGIKARVTAGGEISAGGRVGLGAGMPADLKVGLDKVRYSDGRIVQATVDANLALEGPLADAARGARLSGTVTIDRANITIPSSLPAAIDPVSVTHINAPEAVRRQDQALQAGNGSRAGGGSSPIALDVTVNAPGRIFIRGRGLDAEMGGSLRIAGTTASPQAVGAFTMRRGLLNVLSRRVVFSKGEVSFSGSLDPRLNFVASSQTSAATVNIAITGLAQKPDISFTSTPELPQDEVLAQFLFDRSMSQLSPAQIAQLGASVLTLTGGGGGGPLGSLRNSLGLDAVDIDTSSSGNPSLSVGKYINDRIYLGVSQGTTGNSSRVTVDIDVTKSLKLRGEVGADGDSKAGIFFEREFGK